MARARRLKKTFHPEWKVLGQSKEPADRFGQNKKVNLLGQNKEVDKGLLGQNKERTIPWSMQ